MEEKKIQKELALVKRLDTYNIVIPEEVESKIRFLCSKVWDTEWSGVLFYKPSGSFEDNTLSIRCVDIFPMDIGNSTYTEFDMSPDVIGYMTDNDLLDCQMGLCHSHNNMATFFSGTDIATLKEEGRDRNHFVSLIVNNAGSYTAAVTRKVKYVETRKLSYNTFDAQEIIDAEEAFEETEELEYFYLNINFENKPKDGFQEIAARLEEIKKAKEEKKKKEIKTDFKQPSYYGLSAYPSLGTGYGQSAIKQPTLFDGMSEEEIEELKDYNSSFGISGEIEISNKTKNKVTDSLIKDLTCQLITGSVTMTKHDKFDPKKWVSTSMIGLFNKRFGSGLVGLSHCKEWAIDFVDYLCNFTIDTDDHDETEISYLISSGIIENLKTLPKNDYIDLFIDLLQTYAEYI